MDSWRRSMAMSGFGLFLLFNGITAFAEECVLDGGAATVSPCRVDATLPRGVPSTSAELLFRNPGLSLITYTIASTDANCVEYRPLPWLSPDTESVHIPPLAQTVVQFTFSGSELKDGVHWANLCISSNPRFIVPVRLTVGDHVFIDGFEPIP